MRRTGLGDLGRRLGAIEFVLMREFLGTLRQGGLRGKREGSTSRCLLLVENKSSGLAQGVVFG